MKNFSSKSRRHNLLWMFMSLIIFNMEAQTTVDCSSSQPWNSATAYVAGDLVTYNGDQYHANFWTQGQQPNLNSGDAGSGQPWTLTGTCGTNGTVTSDNTWKIIGNLNITSSNFLGTTNWQPLIFKANNAHIMEIYPGGNIQIGGFPTVANPYFKTDITGRVAMRPDSGTNQNNILTLYSNNQITTNYTNGFRHYMAFSHVTFPSNLNQEIGVFNAYEYNSTSGAGYGKHMLIQNTPEGNLGIGVFNAAPDAKLTVNGLTKITAADGVGGDVVRLFNPTPTSTGRNHYVYVANRKFDGDQNTMYGAFGAYESTPGSTTAEGPKHLLIQEQFNSGGNLGIGYHRTAPVAKLSVQGTTFLNGTVGIGDSYVPSGFMLSVNGKIVATEVHVKLRNKWPDYVFDKNYKLMPIDSLADYVMANKHLPQVPSAEEVKDGGILLGEMDAMLLKKVEELTLYIIEQQKIIAHQMDMIGEQQKILEEQEKLNQQLLKRMEVIEEK